MNPIDLYYRLTKLRTSTAYFVAYGSYGARAPMDPALKYSVALWSLFFVGLAYAGKVAWDVTRKLKFYFH
jgi:protease II